MKKRYLKPWFQHVLETISMLLTIFFGSLCSFDPNLPTVLTITSLLGIWSVIVYVLNRYGRYSNGL